MYGMKWGKTKPYQVMLKGELPITPEMGKCKYQFLTGNAEDRDCAI